MSLKEYLYFNKSKILIFIILIIIGVSSYLVYGYYKKISKESISIEKKLVKKSDSNNDLEKDKTLDLKKDDKKLSDDIYVDIKGEIVNPGVYKINKGLRVNDLIKLAGGLKRGADTSFINLSKILKDEEVVIIYNVNSLRKEEAKARERMINDLCKERIKNDACIKTKEITSTSKIVNINTASKEELMTLKGVGDVMAQKIIDYRSKSKFMQKEDLKKVAGIGDSFFDKIKENITI